MQRLGECCSVAGVALASCDLSIRSASSVESTNEAVPCVLEALSESFYFTFHMFFFGDRGRIRLHTRDLPRRVLQPSPRHHLASSASLSGCYEQRFVRRVKLATAVSSSSCTPSRHASLLLTVSTAQYMYYPCAAVVGNRLIQRSPARGLNGAGVTTVMYVCCVVPAGRSSMRMRNMRE
jgi:hypothetical protein